MRNHFAIFHLLSSIIKTLAQVPIRINIGLCLRLMEQLCNSIERDFFADLHQLSNKAKLFCFKAHSIKDRQLPSGVDLKPKGQTIPEPKLFETHAENLATDPW